MSRNFIYCLGLVCCLLSCGKSPTAGGSSDSGNVKFAGILHDAHGEMVAGAVVVLCPATYAGDSTSDNFAAVRKTVTDESGHFSFDSLDTGDYCVEGNDQVANAVLMKFTIGSRSDRQIFKEDTLRPYAVIKGSTGRIASGFFERYLSIFGLDRKVKVDRDGNFSLNNLPAGSFHVRITSTDSEVSPVDTDGIALAAGDTLSIPYLGWRHRTRIMLNTTASGADMSATITDFPVLVRLTKGMFAFDDAGASGADIRFVKTDNTPLAFEIERWDAEKGLAEIWVKIDTVYGNDNSHYFIMLWGNPIVEPPDAKRDVFDTLDGFQAVWHLGDTDADLVTDATGNDFSGIAYGMTAASVIDGIIGRARMFDGAATSIVINNSSDGSLNFPQDSSYSLSAWVYARLLNDGSHVVISKGDEQYFLCSVDNSSSASEWTLVDYKDHTGWQSTSGDAAEGQWTYLSGVRRGTSQYLFINGDLVDSTVSLLSSVKSRITDFDVAIGMFIEKKGDKEGDSYFDGYIDEVRIYDVPLDAAWIRLCYMNQRSDDRLLLFENHD